MGVHSVEMWTGDDDGLTRLLSVPHRAGATTAMGPAEAAVLRRSGVAGEAWLALWLPELLVGRGDAQVRVAPVGYGSDLLGALVVEQPREAERIRADDERTLGEVSRRLGVVLHNRALDAALQASLDDLRRTNDELRASRLRLVSTADAERRRIERDIHDGAQQHLAALAVNLGLARQLLADEGEDRAAVGDLLASMTDDVRATIAEVRDLAHGIYPPLLRQAGLPDALKAAAQRSAGPVTVQAEDVGRPGPDVEAALYFCVLEALQNVAKHAPGASVAVRLATDPDSGDLVLSVADDGPGFSQAGDPAGQGQQNMVDRMGAIGGTVAWTSAPGSGTTVELRLPRPGGSP
jgi:signal transduction histidine kinase